MTQTWAETGPVVKGWAADRASAHLARLDDTDYRLSAGGDITCRAGAADLDATAAYAQGEDAAAWLSGRPIRSALVVAPDGGVTTVVPSSVRP